MEVDAAGRTPWVVSRWEGLVFLSADALDEWIAAWRAEVAARKMG